MAQHGCQPRPVVGHQLVDGGSAGAAHGGHDAAAGVHDRHVGRAGQPLLEFAGAVTQPGQVGVGIDKAGQHTAAGGVDARGRVVAAAQVGGCAYGHDAPIAHGQRAFFDHPQIAQSRAALGAIVGRHDAQLRRGMD